MFKVPHGGEERSTMTKKPHRFEIYENWSGNTFKRRFVSTVTCYADPARDPKARADGNIPQPGEARTFPLPRTNERYQMIIKEVPGGSMGGKIIQLYLKRNFKETETETDVNDIGIRLWRGVRTGNPAKSGDLLDQSDVFRKVFLPKDYSAEEGSPHCFYHPPDWQMKWNQTREEPIWISWDLEEQVIETKDEAFKDRADPTKWKNVVVLDHPEPGRNLIFSFVDLQSNETKKLFLNAELLTEVADGPIEVYPPIVRGSADIESLPSMHHSFRYKYFRAVEYEGFQAVLTYMYTGEIGFCADNSGVGVSQGLSDAEDIFGAASQIHYTVLKQRAFNFLRETLLVENVIARLTRAYRNNYRELLDMYQDFFYENWDTISQSGNFDEFHKVAGIDFAFSFGKWFSWGFLDRAINDEKKLYDPQEILKTFENAQHLLAERARLAQIGIGKKDVAPN